MPTASGYRDQANRDYMCMYPTQKVPSSARLTHETNFLILFSQRFDQGREKRKNGRILGANLCLELYQTNRERYRYKLS